MSKPLPRVSEVNRAFYEGALKGELRLQQCEACRKWIYFPRVACPHCLEDRLGWVTASGRGSVYSFALVHRPQHPSFNGKIPIVLAAVALAEGPVIISEITGVDPTQVFIGMPVEAVWEQRSEEVAVVHFRPTADWRSRASSREGRAAAFSGNPGGAGLSGER